MLLALSDVTYVLIGWFKFSLLKLLYEYGPWCLLYSSWRCRPSPASLSTWDRNLQTRMKWVNMCSGALNCPSHVICIVYPWKKMLHKVTLYYHQNAKKQNFSFLKCIILVLVKYYLMFVFSSSILNYIL